MQRTSVLALNSYCRAEIGLKSLRHTLCSSRHDCYTSPIWQRSHDAASALAANAHTAIRGLITTRMCSVSRGARKNVQPYSLPYERNEQDGARPERGAYLERRTYVGFGAVVYSFTSLWMRHSAMHRLDVHILDYLKKRNFPETAAAFRNECHICEKPRGQSDLS